MKTKSKDLKTSAIFVPLIAIFCTLLWGTAFPAIKIGYVLFAVASEDIPAKLLFAGLRFMIAGLIVLEIGALRPDPDGLPIRLRKKDIAPIALLSLFQTFMQYFLLYIGIGGVSGTRSALYTSVAAFASVLVAPLFFKSEKITIKALGGCILGIAGLAVLLTDSDAGGFTLTGDLLVILSNMSGAAGNIVSKKISDHRRPEQVSGWQLLMGGTALTVIGLLFGGRLNAQDHTAWLLLLYLGAMAGIAFLLWTMLLRNNPVGRVAVFNFLIPIFGTMWSGIFLFENIFTLQNILSLLLVSMGIFIVNFRKGFRGQDSGFRS